MNRCVVVDSLILVPFFKRQFAHSFLKIPSNKTLFCNVCVCMRACVCGVCIGGGEDFTCQISSSAIYVIPLFLDCVLSTSDCSSYTCSTGKDL